MLLPVRVTRSQYGTERPEAVVSAVLPPVVVRRWNDTELFGRIATMLSLEFPARVSRIMTPAFAVVCVFCIPVTRAVMLQSPLASCHAKWNTSELPQMSVPAPATCQIPFTYLAFPASPTDPISCFCQGLGSPCETVTAIVSESCLAG